MVAGQRTGDQRPLLVIQVLLNNPAPGFVDVSYFGELAVVGWARTLDTQAARADRGRAYVGDTGIEVDDAQGLDQPGRFDREDAAQRTGGELLVPTEVERRRLLAADPEPEHLFVAAQVDFGSGERVLRAEAESP